MSEIQGQLNWDIVCTGNNIEMSDTGLKIQEIYGGFGQGQKILTVPQIAALHVDDPHNAEEVRRRISRINELINNNIVLPNGDKYFEFGIDIIDLKSVTVSNGNEKIIKNLTKNHIYTQNAVNRATNLYILSEQGYSLLINLMTDARSKLLYKKVIRDYFHLKDLFLTNIDTEQYMLRLFGKKERKQATDAIKYFIDRGDLINDEKHNAYAIGTNYVYKLLFGMTSKRMEEYLELDLKPYDTVRNYLCAEDIDAIMHVEGRMKYMQEDNKSYQEIWKRLKELYPNPKVPKLAQKNISFIRRLMLEA